MPYISARERNIIVDLTNPNFTATYENLSERYNCSVRTIRRDLIAIESLLSTYDLALRYAQESLTIEGTLENIQHLISELSIYEYSEIERLIVIFELLISTHDYIKTFTLLSALKLSQNTLSKDLDLLEERILKHHGILEKKRSAGIKLILSEEAIRRVLQELLLDYLSMYNVVSLFEGTTLIELINPDMHALISKLISLEKYSHYMQMIQQKASESRITINDTVLIQTALYLTIIDQRQGKITESKDSNHYDERVHPFLESLTFPKSDIENFGRFLANTLRYDLIINYDYETLNLIDRFIQDLREKVHLSVKLKHRIYVDVLAWYQRLNKPHQELTFDPDILKGLNEEYPDITHAVQDLTRAHFSHDVSLTDIVDLIMFLVAHIENEQSLHTLNILVVCVGGMGSSRMIVTRLKNKYAHFNFKNISLVDLPLQEKNSYDFIISTVALSMDGYDVIKVSPLLFEKDIRLINQKIRQTTLNKTLISDNKPHYSTEITLENTHEKTIETLLKEYLEPLQESHLAMTTDEAIEMFLRYQSLGYGIPNSNLAIYHIRSSKVLKQRLSFIYSSSPITVPSMTRENLIAHVHVVMMSTETMTYTEKNLFNTVSILMTRNKTFQNLMMTKNLPKIIQSIEKEMAYFDEHN